jgi:hypothetical protein
MGQKLTLSHFLITASSVAGQFLGAEGKHTTFQASLGIVIALFHCCYHCSVVED